MRGVASNLSKCAQTGSQNWHESRKYREKGHQEINAQICYFPKGPTNSKTLDGVILSRNGSKDYRPRVWFQGAGVPGSGAQVRACDKRRDRTAERKKEAKKENQVQRCGGRRVRRYAKVDNGAKIENKSSIVKRIKSTKRDLNTPVGQGLANLFFVPKWDT